MQKRYVLFLIPIILYIGLLGILPQMEPDEARYSLIPSAMNETGNYVTPQLKHIIYMEKPPLVYWATAMFFKVFGENDFSARLFVGLCAWGCILLAYFIGRNFRDEKTGLYAAAVLTISAFPFALGRINILDTPMTFFICLSIWLGYLALKYQEKKYIIYLYYFSCALAFLTKGVIGVVFPCAILVLWLLWAGRLREIWKLISPVGIIIFLIVVSPWLILAQKENPDFLWFFFLREHLLRFTTRMHGKTEPFYYYLPIIIGGILPWLIYMIKAWPVKSIKETIFTKDENKLLLIWILFIFLFYTLSSSKLATYIAPVFLPIALFAGIIFRQYEENTIDISGKKKIFYRLMVILQSSIIIVALFIPPILNKYSDPSKGLVVMTSDKWWLYIILPLLAAVLLVFLPDLIERKIRRCWFLTVYALCVILSVSSLFLIKDFLAPYRSALVTKEPIAQYVPKDQDLYQYRENFYGIDFYNKIRTPIVVDFGELAEGMEKLPPAEKKRYFLTQDEFIQLCAQRKDVYCITQHKKKLEEIKSKVRHVDILWDNKAFYLLHISNQ
jgi:4-amino-4-deoxy-L-arabinose transferase-like glycosyltransferase